MIYVYLSDKNGSKSLAALKAVSLDADSQCLVFETELNKITLRCKTQDDAKAAMIAVCDYLLNRDALPKYGVVLRYGVSSIPILDFSRCTDYIVSPKI